MADGTSRAMAVWVMSRHQGHRTTVPVVPRREAEGIGLCMADIPRVAWG
jgi:hypothetical protein